MRAVEVSFFGRMSTSDFVESAGVADAPTTSSGSFCHGAVDLVVSLVPFSADFASCRVHCLLLKMV